MLTTIVTVVGWAVWAAGLYLLLAYLVVSFGDPDRKAARFHVCNFLLLVACLFITAFFIHPLNMLWMTPAAYAANAAWLYLTYAPEQL